MRSRTHARGMSAAFALGGAAAMVVAAAVPTLAFAATAAPVATVARRVSVAWRLGVPPLHPAQRLPFRGVHRASRTSVRTALDPRILAETLVAGRGWYSGQWTCLDELWSRESGWRFDAVNYGSGAYGIPQALPAWKMATAGPDWRTDPLTQIQWGLGYIAGTYGTPCTALAHSDWYGYY
ncbi:MAG TPA: hypothetical protein VNG13_10915 [Mycobacteriales bacterium]|nr:hypothetical protein [Mycobacteriales bacterium]